MLGREEFNFQSVEMSIFSNVAGAGDVVSMSIMIHSKSNKWEQMREKWGQNWMSSSNSNLIGSSLSFHVTMSDGSTLTIYHVVPSNWQFGEMYEIARQFPTLRVRLAAGMRIRILELLF